MRANRARTRSQTKDKPSAGASEEDAPSRKRHRGDNAVKPPEPQALQLVIETGTLAINLQQRRLEFVSIAQKSMSTTRAVAPSITLLDAAKHALGAGDDAAAAAASTRLLTDGKRDATRGLLCERHNEMLFSGSHTHPLPDEGVRVHPVRLLLPIQAEAQQQQFRHQVQQHLEATFNGAAAAAAAAADVEAVLCEQIDYCFQGAFVLFARVDGSFLVAYKLAVLDLLGSLLPPLSYSQERTMLVGWLKAAAAYSDVSVPQDIKTRHRDFLQRYRAHSVDLLCANANAEADCQQLTQIYPLDDLGDGFVTCEYIEYILEAMRQLEAPETRPRAERALQAIRTHLTASPKKPNNKLLSPQTLNNAVKNGYTPSLHYLASLCMLMHLAPADLVPTNWFRFLHETLITHIRGATGGDITLSKGTSSSSWTKRIEHLRECAPRLFCGTASEDVLPPSRRPFIAQEEVARILARLYFLWGADEFEQRLSPSVEWCLRYVTLVHGDWPTVMAAYHVFFAGTPQLFRDRLDIDNPQLRRVFNPFDTRAPHADSDLFRPADFSSVEQQKCETIEEECSSSSSNPSSSKLPHLLLAALCAMGQTYHVECAHMQEWARRSELHQPLTREDRVMLTLEAFKILRPRHKHEMTSVSTSLVAQLVHVFNWVPDAAKEALFTRSTTEEGFIGIDIPDEKEKEKEKDKSIECVVGSAGAMLDLVALHIEQPFFAEALHFLDHALHGVSHMCFATTALRMIDTSQLPKHLKLNAASSASIKLFASNAHVDLLFFLRNVEHLIAVCEARHPATLHVVRSWRRKLGEILERHSYVVNLVLLESPAHKRHRWKFLADLPNAHRVLSTAFRERLIRASLFSVQSNRVVFPRNWSRQVRESYQPQPQLQQQQQQQQNRVVVVAQARLPIRGAAGGGAAVAIAPAPVAVAVAVVAPAVVAPALVLDGEDEEGDEEEEEDDEDEEEEKEEKEREEKDGAGDVDDNIVEINQFELAEEEEEEENYRRHIEEDEVDYGEEEYDNEEDDDDDDDDGYSDEDDDGADYDEEEENEEMRDRGGEYDDEDHEDLRRRIRVHTVRPSPGVTRPFELNVDRASIVGSTLGQLETLKFDDISAGFQVKFKSEDGKGDGLLQEWISIVSDYVFSSLDCWLPCEYDTRTFVFNPASTNTRIYQLAGKLHALALLTRTKMRYCLAPHLLRFLMSGGTRMPWTDLQYVSVELYTTLKNMLACEDLSLLDQTFVVSNRDIDTELVPGGADKLLTNDNKGEFAEAFARHHLLDSQGVHITSFLAAFQSLTRANLFPHHLVSNRELVAYLCGDLDLDVPLLRQLTEYDDFYSADSSHIVWFWELFGEMTETQRKCLLFFSTSSSQIRVHSKPVFLIQRSHPKENKAKPSAQTCFRTLLLPSYSSKQVMREQLHWLLACPSRYQSFGNI